MFAGNFQTGAERGLLDCEGVTRIWKCGASPRTRSNQVPTSGEQHSYINRMNIYACIINI